MEMSGVAPTKMDFFGFQINETVIIAWFITLGVLVFSLLVKYYFVPRFKQVPSGLQLMLETVIGFMNRLSANSLGEHGKVIAPYMTALGLFLVISGMTHAVGLRIPATDLNFTISIALITFVLIFAFGFRYKGVKGVITGYAKPIAFIAPFRLIADLVIPVSLSFRMFGNMFAGFMVLELIYNAMGAFSVGVPALLNLYFTLFDVLIQTFVFMMLTLSYINEKIE